MAAHIDIAYIVKRLKDFKRGIIDLDNLADGIFIDMDIKKDSLKKSQVKDHLESLETSFALGNIKDSDIPALAREIYYMNFLPKSESRMKLSLKERKLVREYAKKLIESNSDNITADELVKKISTETEIKVNFTGAWDLLDSIKGAKVITINRGKGFEEAIKVTSNHGDFLYMPPFKMEAEATDTTLLLFYADDAIFIKS